MGKFRMGKKEGYAEITPIETEVIVKAFDSFFIVEEPKTVEKIVYVPEEKIVYVDQLVYIDRPIEKLIEVEKIVHVDKYIELPVEVLKEIEKIVYVDKHIDRPVEVIKQILIHKVPKWCYWVMSVEAIVMLAILLIK